MKTKPEDIYQQDLIENQRGIVFSVTDDSCAGSAIGAVCKYVPARYTIGWKEVIRWGIKEDCCRVSHGRNYVAVSKRTPNAFNAMMDLEPTYVRMGTNYKKMLLEVPYRDIVKTYSAKEKLVSVLTKSNVSPIEQDLLNAVSIISNCGIPSSELGVSGSILFDATRPFSDLDLVVYGARNSRKLYEAYPDFLSSPGVNASTVRSTNARRAATILQTDNVSKERRNKRKLKKALLSITQEGRTILRRVQCECIRMKSELPARFEEYMYVPIGETIISSRVSNDDESFVRPARYKIEDVKIIKWPLGDGQEMLSVLNKIGSNVSSCISSVNRIEIEEIVGSNIIGIARTDDILKAKGILEFVQTPCRKYFRLSVEN